MTLSTRALACCLTAVATTAIVNSAAAQDRGLYLGAGLGQSTFQASVDTDSLVNRSYSEIPLIPIDEGQPVREGNRVISGDDSDNSFKLFGGYRFNRILAVELAYADLGSASTSVLTDELEAFTTIGGEGVFRGSQRTDLSYEAQVATLAARATLPIGKRFRIFGKLGVTYYDGETTRLWLTSGSNNIPGQAPVDASINRDPETRSHDGTAWMAGVGAGINLGRSWGVDVEYESYQDIDLGEFVGSDAVDTLSVSVTYSF